MRTHRDSPGHLRGRRLPPLVASLAALVALGGGCVVTSEKIDGTHFTVEIAAHGREKRFVAVDCAVDSGSGRRGVEIVDVTTIDDDANARRKLRIESAANAGDPRPGSGHLDFATVAVRPIDLVIVYRGHEDIFHLSFPREGGIVAEPSDGEFTRVIVRGNR